MNGQGVDMERGSALGVQARSHPSLPNDWIIVVIGSSCWTVGAAQKTALRRLILRAREFQLSRRITTQRELPQGANRIQWVVRSWLNQHREVVYLQRR